MWRPPTLETPRLTLRAFELEDASDVFSYSKNPNISKYTLWEPHKVIEDAQFFIEEYAFSYYQEEVPEPFAIVQKKSGRVIGSIGCFWVSKKNKEMEMAYALDENFWGQGLVAEAGLKIMEYCFSTYELERIQCRCKYENSSSSRVMEKLGMTFEGTLRSKVFHRDRHWDMKCYSILKSEWERISE